jgi:hypothetical protein
MEPLSSRAAQWRGRTLKFTPCFLVFVACEWVDEQIRCVRQAADGGSFPQGSAHVEEAKGFRRSAGSDQGGL